MNSTLSGLGTVLNISSRCSSEVLPATLTSGLGLLQVWGRIRVPQPAMGIKILRVSFILQFYRVKWIETPYKMPLFEFTNAPAPDAVCTALRAALFHRWRA